MSQIFEVHPQNPQPRLLKQAAQILRDGGIAAVPTDSSYALVCRLDDRAAVDVTRYPPGLVGALGKIRDRGADVPGANPLGAHLWLVPPAVGSLLELPSIDDRIAALREL